MKAFKVRVLIGTSGGTQTLTWGVSAENEADAMERTKRTLRAELAKIPGAPQDAEVIDVLGAFEVGPVSGGVVD